MSGPWVKGTVVRCTERHQVDFDEDRQEERWAEPGTIGVITDDQTAAANPFSVVWQNGAWGFYTEGELETGTEPVMVHGRDYTIYPDTVGATESILPIMWAKGLEPIGPSSNPRARLNARLEIAGVTHYLEAIEVKEGSDGTLEPVLETDETNFEAVQIGTAEGPLLTVDIGGRPYVLLMTPGTD